MGPLCQSSQMFSRNEEHVDSCHWQDYMCDNNNDDDDNDDNDE